MEVHLTDELEAQLEEIASTTGRTKDQLVEDAMAGYIEELKSLRRTLDRRYDEIKSGGVTVIDGEEAFEQLRRRGEARRNSAL